MKIFKQTTAVVLGLALFLTFSGTVLADAPLDEAIDELIGTDYKYGGTNENGFDCSGFTQYVFNEFGIDLTRSSKSQALEGTKVAKKNLRKGDLVFFKTNGKSISHVGIYLGSGKFAHASSKNGVTINDLSEAYYVKYYVTARRVLTDAEYKKIATETEQKADADAAATSTAAE